LEVGPDGQVVGIDMTDEQLNKARHLRADAGFDQITTARVTSSRFRTVTAASTR